LSVTWFSLYKTIPSAHTIKAMVFVVEKDCFLWGENLLFTGLYTLGNSHPPKLGPGFLFFFFARANSQEYQGADKSLARPEGKQALKHVGDERDFNNI